MNSRVTISMPTLDLSISERARTAQLTAPVQRSALAVPLWLEGPRDAAIQPVTVGIPFPKGMLTDSQPLVLCDPDGHARLLQTSVLARWSDNSVKWLLADFMTRSSVQDTEPWVLRADEGGVVLPAEEALRVCEYENGFDIDTGVAKFSLRKTLFPPFTRIVAGGGDVVDAESFRVLLTDARGHKGQPRVEHAVLEARGPVRATLRLEGIFRGAVPFKFVARFCFFAGTGLVRLRLTLHNPNRARHPGGLWDLGDPGSMLFRDLSLQIGLPSGRVPQAIWKAERAHDARTTAGALEIYQDSSGGENWQSANHINRHGRVPCSLRGYRVRDGHNQTAGLRASPVICLHEKGACITAAVPEFWQQFPKAIGVEGSRLRIGLFPRQWRDLFELQAGEQKTHTVWLNFASGPSSAASLDWVHAPLVARAAPKWYARSGAFPHLLPAGQTPQHRLEPLLHGAIHGAKSLTARRELIDEYGWRNYGEIYSDHESAHDHAAALLISHYNNQYDLLHGAVQQFMRTGDVEWFRLLGPLARHFIDIDVYHTSHDRAAYNGGPFWHTDHYRDAATGTHRGFSRANRGRLGRSYGGGPCNEHNYTTGLLHYYYLTGNEQAKETVLGLADWVIRSDDGTLTPFGILDDGPTGAASATRDPDYHGPGRGCGNSVNALLDAWLLSGEKRYLDKAEILIQRAVHPHDDVAAMGLNHAESRWSYTVFLVVLARYLEVKAEAAQIDAMHSYARSSLLHYAKWMLIHERPYLDRHGQLEFPTETWAAHDFRKANVLRLAAAHAREPMRSELLHRGNELADRAADDLLSFSRPDTARSLSILMTELVRDSFFRTRTPDAAPAPIEDVEFAPRETFIPQRRLSLRGRKLFRLLDPWRWRKYFSQRATAKVSADEPVICHLLHGLGVGGAEMVAARLARQHRDHARFVFICLDELGTLGEELLQEGFAVHLLHRRPGIDWRCSVRLATLLRRERVTLVHAHQYTSFFYAQLAHFLYPRAPLLLTEHGRQQPDHPRRKRMLANRLLLSRRDRLVAVGSAVGRAMIDNDGMPEDRVEVIYNGVDPLTFAQRSHDRQSTRAELGIGDGDFVIIQVARLDYLKDHITAVRAMERIVPRRANARMLLVGDGPERPAIEELLRGNGLGAHVCLLGVRRDIPRLLAAADLALLTSISEGIPLTLLEAMAAGLPVVSTDVGGVGEIISDEQTGLLCKVKDDAQLAESILRLADDPQERARLGRNGCEHVRRAFSEEQMHAGYLRLYREMLASR